MKPWRNIPGREEVVNRRAYRLIIGGFISLPIQYYMRPGCAQPSSARSYEIDGSAPRMDENDAKAIAYPGHVLGS
jgi:hypothetical protein